MVGKESKMKNKFIRKWLVILTVAAMMIPAGIPANAETVEEGENIAPTAGISAETPNVTAETQKEEISAEMPDMTAETQNEEKSDVQAEGQNQAKQGVLEAVRQNTEKAEEASDAVDVQAEERTAGEVQIGEQIYPTLTEAFAAAKDGDVLRLLENAEVSQPILLTKNVTLDTNGFTVSAAAGFKGNFMFTNRGTFNIVGSGKIDGSVGTYPLIMINNTGGAVLNIQSSEITGQGVVQNAGGIVNITGGTLTASARNTVLSQFGEVHIGASAHLMAAGEGKSAVQLIGAKMTLSGDAVLSGNGGIDVFNSNRNEEGTVSAQVEITGGRIETKDFPVSGNNQESAGAEVAITGGSLKNISGGTAIYWPMEGQLTIGGNAVIEGGTGIEAKMGTITIKDNAVITGSGEWKEEKPQNGGANPEGSAFLGSAQMYDGCINDSSLVVNILGGTLKSVNGNAVTIYNTEEKSDVRADISVTGGSLQPAAGKGAVKVITSGDNTTRFDPDKKTLDTMKSNTTVKVAKDVAAAATDRDGKTTYYNTVEEALGSNTEDGNIHIYINENSSVKQEALEGENVILTVAPGVVLEVTSGIDGMIVKETVHEDGSKTYELVNAEELSAPKNVTVTADCKTVHIGKKIRLKASAEHDTKQVNYLYRWYKDGALLNGAVSAELEVTESGNYAVEVFAVLEKDGTTLTSLGAKSDPVKCTVTPHEYEEKWSSDGKVHWHECTICKNKTDVAEHTFGEWKVTEKATEKKDGRKERICTVCGHKETAVIKAAGKTEEPRKESDKTASVKTGDKTDPAVYIFFVILTGGMIVILSAGNRKNRRK